MTGLEATTGAAPGASCRARLLTLLAVRERCQKELCDRLVREGFEPTEIEEQIAWAQSTNLLNEQRFAEAYIAGKLHSGWGRPRIERELRNLGIDLESLDGYPQTLFPEDERVRAQMCAEKLSLRSKNHREAIYRNLTSKGFDTDVARSVAAGFPRVDPVDAD